MRLIACDQQLIFSDAIGALLGRYGHRVVARVATPAEGLRLPGFADVDGWLSEVDFSSRSTTSPVRELRAAMPTMPIVVFTSDRNRAALQAAAADGANGAVLKSEPVDELARVLRRAVSGVGRSGTSADRPVWSVGVKATLARPVGGRVQDGLASLTAKEQEVMARLTNGASTRAIASGMAVEVSTVRTHLQHLYTKLNVHSRLELVALAARLNGPAPLRAVVSRAS